MITFLLILSLVWLVVSFFGYIAVGFLLKPGQKFEFKTWSILVDLVTVSYVIAYFVGAFK